MKVKFQSSNLCNSIGELSFNTGRPKGKQNGFMNCHRFDWRNENGIWDMCEMTQ